MDNAIKPVKHNDKWHFDITEEAKALHDERMASEGRVKIEERYKVGTGAATKWEKIIYYLPKETCLEVRGKWKRKVDVIIDEFGEAEWTDRLRSELGIAEEMGIKGIHQFMKSAVSRAKYREIRDEVAEIAKERIEARHI